MIIILEGMDRCGKSTIAKSIQNKLYEIDKKPTIICKYNNIQSEKINIEETSKKHYEAGFKFIAENIEKYNLIFDRFHIGEYVYSPIYRNYVGDYVFNIEKKYKSITQSNKIKLIILIDNPEKLLKREDNKSLSNDIRKKRIERAFFKDAYNHTTIKNKLLININGKLSIKDVNKKAKDFIFNE